MTLTSRGMLDRGGELPSALMEIGYFRLSGYWRYFQLDPRAGLNDFAPGTDIADVLSVYRTDAEVRNLLLEGMAEVEIALRAVLIARLCPSGGSGTEYLAPALYVNRQNKDGEILRDLLLAQIRDDLSRSKERHVRHYRARDENTVPLWVANEALSLGTVSRLYGLLADDKLALSIAGRFGYKSVAHFANNLRSVTVFRNICAHHARVWNRQVQNDVPRIFPALVESTLSNANYVNTSWGVISVLSDMVRVVRKNDTFADAVRDCIPQPSMYWTGLIDPTDT